MRSAWVMTCSVLLIGFAVLPGGYLGVDIRPVDAEDEAKLGVKPGQGIVVTEVAEGGPAEKAGLKVDDVIVSADQKAIKKPEDLIGIMKKKNAGDTVKFSVLRAKEKQEVEVTLTERPANADAKLPPRWLKQAREEFTKKAAGLKADDIQGHYDLGMWARQNGLAGAAQVEFHKALAADPDHADARKAAGYVKKDDRWVRDYVSPARKIKAEPDKQVAALPHWKKFQTLFSDEQSLAKILAVIDQKVGLYRHADDIEVTIKILSRAEGQGVTWPESVMPSGKRAPPFRSTIELDSGAVLNSGAHARAVLTHEMTHALQGETQPWWPSWFAEGIASYVGDDGTSAYAAGASFFARLEKSQGPEKFRAFLKSITDDWKTPDEAAQAVFGKNLKELGSSGK